MTEVRWTTQAADDLQAIYDFIGRDSEQYAQVIVEGVLAAIDNLKRKSHQTDVSPQTLGLVWPRLSQLILRCPWA